MGMRLLRANFRHFNASGASLALSIGSQSSLYFVGLSTYSGLSGVNFPNSSSMLSFHLWTGRVEQARAIFDDISSPGVRLWTMMVSAYAKIGRLDDALKLFYKMPVKDTVSWNSMIKGCVDCGDLVMAKKIFDEMPERNVVSWTTMVDSFLGLGRVEVAERLFHEMPSKDVASWNCMIYGYFRNGRVKDALKLFEEMPFRDVISWTSMIAGLDQNGESYEALLIFQKMMASGVEITPSTLACVLTSCANLICLCTGAQIHCLVAKLGCLQNEYVSASLITFYANCLQIQNSFKLFRELLHKNVVVWTALITGYGTNGRHEDALKVFFEMIKNDVHPNQSSLTSALNSCCGLESLDNGKEVHTIAKKMGMEQDVFVGNSLVVMYTKCGYINDGLSVFKRISEKNIVSWNSIIVGCAQNGCGLWALTLYAQMIRARVNPDEITFTGVLYACSHTRLLTKGRSFFKHFSRDESVEMKFEHYASMVDLLSRCGQLEEAEELIKNMPAEANSTIWLALLSNCRTYSDIDVAERAANSIFVLQPHCSAAYVLLSNIYASAGRWDDVGRIRRKMKHNGVSKEPGCSWVTLKGSRHEFLSGDISHPLIKGIHQKLRWLSGKLKEVGYVPDQNFALHDVEVEQRQESLTYHSERLAIGFCLISTVEGSTITVMKNLRVCGDCHPAIKLMSKIVGREIIVRDSSRFHHFWNGVCSCGDYW